MTGKCVKLPFWDIHYNGFGVVEDISLGLTLKFGDETTIIKETNVSETFSKTISCSAKRATTFAEREDLE